MTSSPRRPTSLPPVQYKGGDLDAERGPGLGCFWIQLVLLGVLVVVTPVGVSLGWPDWLNALLLFATIGLLLVSGQTIIFLLRIVAAERREGRRRPMAVARSSTVGELEDAGGGEPEMLVGDESAADLPAADLPSADEPAADEPAADEPAAPRAPAPPTADPPSGGGVRE
ncbi:MAG TPA: hypothetical protein VEY67_11910 [Candidatus Dormibacteraeota bacterium]|nr:hypothetical protein [Candidatus Dormibacteraeota bacterium]